MPLRTTQMLKKSGINKGNAMSYVTFIVESSTMFVLEKQSAVKPRDQLVRKKKSLHSLWSVEGIPNATYPGQPRPRQQTCAPKSQNFHILSWEPFIFVYSIFQNSILHIFFISIIIVQYPGMFRNVPERSIFLLLTTAHLVTTNLHNASLAYFTFSFRWFATSIG